MGDYHVSGARNFGKLAMPFSNLGIQGFSFFCELTELK